MSAQETTQEVLLDTVTLAPPLSDKDNVRSEAYSLIAALLREPPSEAMLALLASIDVGDCRSTLEHAYSSLQQSASHTNSSSAHQEFQALFIGLGRGELLPFGSWYQTGFMMEQPLATLRQDLQKMGFERQTDIHEPEDHVAALCEVMNYLIHSDSPEQQQFFQTHLQGWIQRFFEDLQNAETANLYISVGFLGQAFMQEEINKFSHLQ